MAYQSWSVVFGEQPSAAKWNILGTNDAHFYSFLGDNLAWQSWTPTWTNATVGNGTVVAAYTQIGKIVHFRLNFTLGSTSAISGDTSFTFPVTADADAAGVIGWARLVDANSTDYIGPALLTSTTACTVRAGRADVAALAETNLSSTAPFTWTTSDQILVNGTYEAA